MWFYCFVAWLPQTLSFPVSVPDGGGPADDALQLLDPTRPYKPLDVGEAGVNASVDAYGRLVAVSQGHPEHGTVTLHAHSPLPQSWRHDQAAVRRWRRRLSARNAAAFGLRPSAAAGPGARTATGVAPAWLAEHALPITGLAGVARPALATLVPHPDDIDGASGVVQILLPARPPVPLAWRGTVCLARAAYAQLTEGGPLPELPRRLSARSTGSEVVLADQDLGWAVALAGDLAPAARVTLRAGRAAVSAPLSPGGRLVALGLGPDPGRAQAAARRLALLDPDAALERALARWRHRWAGWPRRLGPLDPVARRGVGYVLACCAIPVGNATCLVTDHRILPLAWTRDGYFAARALLAWTTATRNPEPARLVRRHLAWLFEVADRPEGWWARSHLVGGQRKDQAFQLDQQLYPLLELADYVELTAEWPLLERYRGAVERALQAIEGRRAAGAALYATEETPADDPLHFPYQTACQLLAWYTLMRLDRLGVGSGRLGRLARSIRDAVRRHQVLADSAPSRYAYATDLAGGKLDYHDANDLPMALAPAWGFCRPDDPVWLATMRFAFHPANPGFAPGPHGGLGSLHTPGSWPLGHIQNWLVGQSIGQADAAAAAQQALEAVALWDGALPEASDPRSGRPRSRPWFAWPGAAVSAVLLDGLGATARDRTQSPDP
jgi:uncharacterized protein